MEDMKRENRRQRRERMAAEVGYKNEKNQTFDGCLTKNISENGVCIVVSEFISVGTMLDLEFKFPLTPTFFYVKGKVARINKLPFNEQWEVGVEMVTDKDYALCVRRYILSLQKVRD